MKRLLSRLALPLFLLLLFASTAMGNWELSVALCLGWLFGELETQIKKR